MPELGAPSGFFSTFTLLSRVFIPPRKYEGKIAAAAKASGLHFLRSVFILSQFDFVFQKVLKSCNFKGLGAYRSKKGKWELIFGISCAYYRNRTIGNKKWFGSEAFFFDVIFAGQQLSRTGKSVIRLSFLAGRGEPQAIAFIYRDRLIWGCRFRQRQLRCTQRNSSCKVSYEYVELANSPCVIVYLWRSIISTGSILSLSLFAFVFPKALKP